MQNSADIDQSRALRRLAPILILVLGFAVIGCYTILKHPITAEEGPQQQDPHPQEYYRQNCVDCHADYSEYPYGYFYGVYPEYYFEYPRWGYYYAYPWWWDRHWYDEPVRSDEGDVAVEGEKASRRGGLVPPYVTGAPAINTGGGSTGGFSLPGAGGSGGKPGTGGSTGAGGDQPDKTRVRVSSKSDSTGTPDSTAKDSETTKTQRRGGTKP